MSNCKHGAREPCEHGDIHPEDGEVCSVCLDRVIKLDTDRAAKLAIHKAVAIINARAGSAFLAHEEKKALMLRELAEEISEELL